jgi:hypothetical protein
MAFIIVACAKIASQAQDPINADFFFQRRACSADDAGCRGAGNPAL